MSRSRRQNWFEELTGVKEVSAEYVRERLLVKNGCMISKKNGASWRHGTLEMPSLKELRLRLGSPPSSRNLRVRVVGADVKVLHADPNHADCVFQVASQFNLLEMVSPNITPEYGIGRYENNKTQGPTCAISAGAGTIYRQYFVPVGNQLGQTARRQVNCLAGLGQTLKEMSDHDDFWTMRNGYAIMSNEQLDRTNEVLQGATEADLDRIRNALRVGIMWNTQVTSSSTSKHLVTQVYCSALPISYCGRAERSLFRPIASLILEGAYEATLATAVLTKKKTVFLTLLGGGAFGNDTEWICAAMDRAFRLYSSWDLEVVIVTYRPTSGKSLKRLVAKWS